MKDLTPNTATASRSLLFLSVQEQMRLTGRQHDGPVSDLSVALSRLALSTGIHPCVLAQPQVYRLSFSAQYIDWCRPKTFKRVTLPWSKAMQEPGVFESLTPKVHRTSTYYAEVVSRAAEHAGIKGRTAFLRLRHSHMVNLARLGYDPFLITHRTGTSLGSIGRHYTVGMAEAKRLTGEEKDYLEWLIEP